MASLKSSPAWKALKAHQKETARAHMRDLFAEDPGRFEAFSLARGGLFLDYSKNRITAETMALLMDLAREADVEGWRGKMAAGDPVNASEGRAALHMALRAPLGGNGGGNGAGDGNGTAPNLGGVMPAVREAREKIGLMAEAVRQGQWTGETGKPVETVVHIGTGGSHQGPAMAVAALRPFRRSGPDIRFVANVDGQEITNALDGLAPETTLFIVASKTFATQETITNALTARTWLMDALGHDAVQKHFIAVTADAKAATDFGIRAENTLPVWDWVGGRTSLWSAMGLPVAIAIGQDRFEDLLAGAHDMDRHFLEAPLDANMPVILGLIGIWNIDFLGAGALAILPYDERLAGLPGHLRQLEMESNGKSVTRDGGPAQAGTAPVVFGETGTRSQHAFHQALHQGRRLIASDFIAALENPAPAPGHHRILLAHFLAQSEALMAGQTKSEAKAAMKADGVKGADAKTQLPHRVFEGNRPSNTLLLDRLDPFTLGQLIALYEHKVFVQAAVWRINPFDQWGVEHGKNLAGPILAELLGGDATGSHSASTRGLIGRIKAGKAETA